MTKAEKKKWAKKLKGYWALREMAYGKFRLREAELEEAMKKDLGENLEFFYGDMHEGCLGIGHSDWERREKGKNYFPLIQRHEFD